MDIAFDTTWCPTCSRQILPKRIQVPITPQPAPAAPAPPPSSPTPQTKVEQTQQTSTRLARNKTGTIRARNGGGLVHGTGRVKPNGTIKRPSPTRKQTAPATVPPPSPVSPPQPAAPIRHKTIIDQSPVPLYCSDECQLADMQSSQGIHINYAPERHGSPVASPENTPAESNDSGIGSSLESDTSSVSSTHSPTSPTTSAPSTAAAQRKPRSGPIPRGYAALASIYDLPPCPPPPPLLPTPPPEPPKRDPADEYSCGIMMAARRIQAALGPKHDKKRPSWSTPASQLSMGYAITTAYGYTGYQQQREVIPGWTDGSDKWRASVYSFARPDEDVAVSMDGDDDRRNNAYRGFVSTPCRSRGVYSTFGESKEGDVKAETPRHVSQPCQRARSEAEELYAKWDMSFTKRSESRQSISRSHQATLLSTSPIGSTHSLPAYAGAPRSKRREVSILKKGAEGKLLVPDVKLKRADSSMSFERMGLSRQGSEASVASRMRFSRSESTSGSSVTEEDEAGLDMKQKSKKPVYSKSWYDDEEFTYPLLVIPRKEKRLVKQVVDGEEVEVEIEVEVIPERKRLFLFPGRDEI